MSDVKTIVLVEPVAEPRPTQQPAPEIFFASKLPAVETLERNASRLAETQQLSGSTSSQRLLVPQSEENVSLLLTAYQRLLAAVKADIPVSAPARRFVQNFAPVEQQLREICVNLKPDFDDHLPKLANGALAAYPRIFGIAVALITHTQSLVSAQLLQRYFRAYQRTSPLCTSELLSVPVMLRVALIDSLCRTTTRILSAHEGLEAAIALSDRLAGLAGVAPDQLVNTITREFDARQDSNRFNSSFVVQLAKRLRVGAAAVFPALDWLRRAAELEGTSLEQHLEMERQWETTAELTILNIVSTLRWIPGFDARQFVENVNLVDPILSKDPTATYSLMEPLSRDSYRRAVISLAAKSGLSEPHVAQQAIDLAAQAGSTNSHDERRAHVGYYLIDDGLFLLEHSLGYRPRWSVRLSRALRASPAAFYLGSVASLTGLIIGCFIFYALHLGASAPLLAGLVLLIVVPVSEVVLNALSSSLPLKPTSLPKLDFSRGVPLQARTMVVVPTVLSSELVVEELIERLEEHYLSNQDSHIFFALLGDWTDAVQENMPGDEALLGAAVEGIKRLNARHGDGGRARFYLFHRRRGWNESEAKWIGWERKRGKLREFNRLLRGAQTTSFISNVGCDVGSSEVEFLAGVRYVLTLDSDTHLGRDAARRLIGTISHPLNEPQLDVQSRRVLQGYGIIQPRVVVLPPGAERSSIPAILTNQFDVNITTPAIPNMYQDLFGQGQYVGKALYDVDVFEAALDNRVPENRLLSHDLLEGMYARPGLASEIKIYDSAESHYEAVTKRQHRWTRGDWQVLPWLLARVRDEQGNSVTNVLPLVARWQIVDTLRRSLMPVALVLWLLAGWTILPGAPGIWTALVILTVAASLSFSVAPTFLIAVRLTPRPKSLQGIQVLVKLAATQVVAVCMQLLISFSFIAHQCCLLSDAIARTLYRRFISHKHLLEWVTAAQVKSDSARSPLMFLRYMWSSLAVALVCGVLIFAVKPAALPFAAPFLLAWMIAPLVANLLSGRNRNGATGRELEVESAMRLNGRRMWRALESFLGLKYQARSAKSPAQTEYVNPLRSTPVNLARLLLWTEAAYQLGSIGMIEMAERLEFSLVELQKVQHSPNQGLEPYEARVAGPPAPQFILAAENGNLAGHLRTLKQSCAEIITRPLFDNRVLKGLADTFSLIKKDLVRIGVPSQTVENATLLKLQQEIETGAALLPMPEQLKASPLTITGWDKLFGELAQQAAIVDEILVMLLQKSTVGRIRELRSWNGSLILQAQGFSRDLRLFYAWAAINPERLIATIREEGQTALASWRQVMELLEQPRPVSQLPEVYDTVLLELEELRAQLELRFATATSEQINAISELNLMKRAVEKSLENSKHFLSLWSRLAQQCKIAAEIPNLRDIFDEERKTSRGY